METVRNKRNLALNKKTHEKDPRSNLAGEANVPRTQKYNITQFSDGIEGRVTEKMSKELNKTENHILGALSRFDQLYLTQ